MHVTGAKNVVIGLNLLLPKRVAQCIALINIHPNHNFLSTLYVSSDSRLSLNTKYKKSRYHLISLITCVSMYVWFTFLSLYCKRKKWVDIILFFVRTYQNVSLLKLLKTGRSQNTLEKSPGIMQHTTVLHNLISKCFRCCTT